MIAFRLAEYLARKGWCYLLAMLFPLVFFVALTYVVLWPLYIYMGASPMGAILNTQSFLRGMFIGILNATGAIGFLTSSWLGVNYGCFSKRICDKNKSLSIILYLLFGFLCWREDLWCFCNLFIISYLVLNSLWFRGVGTTRAIVILASGNEGNPRFVLRIGQFVQK